MGNAKKKQKKNKLICVEGPDDLYTWCVFIQDLNLSCVNTRQTLPLTYYYIPR